MNAISINDFLNMSNPKDGGRRMDSSLQKLHRFVDRLLSNYSHEDNSGVHLSIHNLNDHTKEEFTALLLEDDDRDLYSLYENKNYDEIISKLIRMLKNDCLDTRNDFAESVRNNMTAYYEAKMQLLVNEHIPFYVQGRKEFFGEAA